MGENCDMGRRYIPPLTMERGARPIIEPRRSVLREWATSGCSLDEGRPEAPPTANGWGKSERHINAGAQPRADPRSRHGVPETT
jgi:hypothetical protein